MDFKETIKENRVFIATSIDGYIADKNGCIDFLESVPELHKEDTGYDLLMTQIDALVMGRKTYQTICGFDIAWPYTKPVFVVSNTLTQLTEHIGKDIQLINGSISEILMKIHQQKYHKLYIDGGSLIQSFLREDLIDNMIITTIPVILGSGTPLFSDLEQALQFECISTRLYAGKVAQNHYVRVRN